MPKLRVVFVGAFADHIADGGTGGQLAACRAILNSPISAHVEWLLIDSTMASIPPPSLITRCRFAIRRSSRFLRALWTRPDAVLIFASRGASYVEKSILALAASAYGVRVVFSPRSGLLVQDWRRSRLWRVWIRFTLRYCDVVLCQSESWKKEYGQLTGLGESRLAVFRNPIDLGPYGSNWRYNVASRPFVTVVYVGWLEIYKGIFDLIDALARYRAELTGVRVRILGQGTQAARAADRVGSLNLEAMVQFIGWVEGSSKHQELRAADILVVPSHAEGLPNALLEGMASGLAIVASRVGAIAEVLDEGRCGVLVDPGDVEALGRAIVELVQEKERREVLGRAARAAVAQRHNAARTWPTLLEVLAPARVSDDVRSEAVVNTLSEDCPPLGRAK